MEWSGALTPSGISLRNPLRLLVLAAAALLLLAGGRKAALDCGRDELRAALERQGLALEAGRFEFDWLRGLVVRDLVLALPQGDARQRVGSISELAIDFDLAALLRGEGRIRQLRVREATLELPAADLPLRLEETDADLLLEGGQLHLLEFRARYHGLPVRAHGSLAWRAEGPRPAGDIRTTLESQAPVLAQLERAMRRVQFDPASPGLDLALAPGPQPGQLRVEGVLRAPGVRIGDGNSLRLLQGLAATGEWDGASLHLHGVELRQGAQSLFGELRGAPRLGSWDWRLESTLDLGALLAAAGVETPLPWELRGSPRLSLRGSWRDLGDDWRDGLACFGELAGRDLSVDGRRLESLRTALAWDRGAFQLRNLALRCEGVEWRGSARWRRSEFNAELTAAGPARETLALFGNPATQGLAQVLELAGEQSAARLTLRLDGTSLDPAGWRLAGRLGWDGKAGGTGSGPLRRLLLRELPTYGISGTLAEPRWTAEEAR